MIYKYESNNHDIVTIDPDCPVIPTSVQVPQAMEVIRTSDDKLLQVSSVDTERKTIQGLLLREVKGRNLRWSVQRSQHTVLFVNIVQIVPHVIHAGGIQLMP